MQDRPHGPGEAKAAEVQQWERSCQTSTPLPFQEHFTVEFDQDQKAFILILTWEMVNSVKIQDPAERDGYKTPSQYELLPCAGFSTGIPCQQQ